MLKNQSKEKQVINKMARENLVEMGERIKKIRKNLRITQKEMAAELEMSACYLSEIEGGKGNPGHSFYYKISTRYNVSLNYLFHGEGEMFLRTKFKKNLDIDENIVEIETLDDLLWYLDNSPLLKSQVISFAAKFKYDNEEIIKKNIKRHLSKKD